MGWGAEIRGATFTPVRLAPGYDMDEVDELLDALAAAADRGDRLAPLVERGRLTRSRWREGYYPAEVDDYLELVTGVRPRTVDVGGVPVIEKRRGLFSRVFGRGA